MELSDAALMIHENTGFPELEPSTLTLVPFPSESGRSLGLHHWKKTLLGVLYCKRKPSHRKPLVNHGVKRVSYFPAKSTLYKPKEIQFSVGPGNRCLNLSPLWWVCSREHNYAGHLQLERIRVVNMKKWRNYDILPYTWHSAQGQIFFRGTEKEEPECFVTWASCHM